MRVHPTDLPEVLLLEPTIYEDERGSFCETFNARVFTEKTDVDVAFVQDNASISTANVLRGLHYQTVQAQGKLVRVAWGRIYDVAVDIRRSSPCFGHWTALELDAKSNRQLWVPAGFAHGFLVLGGEDACVCYKTTDYYAPQYERSLRWNDPALAIPWPITGLPRLSPKDADGMTLDEAEVYP
ncbi:MAG: dTDP-4-dehydrorhamnose 3,5-epimerase [Gammaproteobacteria bacterium]|nr:dTDP-4-dehydrorhamnose 3,5-epimerase [Gammaproteobacteria bacterium]